MKKLNNNNQVKVLSVSTILTVALSTMAITLFSLFLTISNTYAAELDDEYEFSGPGIGMKDSSWDYSLSDNSVNYLYNYSLNNIAVEATEELAQGPTTAFDYSVINPFDHSTLNLGPTSTYENNYSLHFINDGGPGMKVQSNELGSTMVYNSGGPGFTTDGNFIIQYDSIDAGPTSVDLIVKPSDYVKFLTMKPGDYELQVATKKMKK